MTELKKGTARAWEIDFARGVAVVIMAAFHAVFDLTVYFGAEISYMTGFWFYAGRFSAILFMFVSGISSTFSKKPIKRGFTVLCFALLITAVSMPVMGNNYIRFGILHFFGTVMILKGVLGKAIKSPNKRAFAAAVMIPLSFVLAELFSHTTVTTALLLPFGLMPAGFNSYDYYPIFPWLSFFSAGVLMAYFFYGDKRSLFHNINISGNFSIKLVCFLGRNSLAVYIIHQPIIIAFLYVVHKFFIRQ